MAARPPNWLTSLGAVAAVVAFGWTVVQSSSPGDRSEWPAAPRHAERSFEQRVAEAVIRDDPHTVLEATAAVLDTYPQLRSAHRYRAWAFERLGNTEQAQQSWAKLRDAAALPSEPVERLYYRALALHGLGQTDEARAVFLEAAERHTGADRVLWAAEAGGLRYAVHAYNAACYWSMAGAHATALEWLARAIDLGYRDATWARVDPDLEPIRDDPEFERIVEEVRRLDNAPEAARGLAPYIYLGDPWIIGIQARKMSGSSGPETHVRVYPAPAPGL